jgi:RHS repeat-associated protein
MYSYDAYRNAAASTGPVANSLLYAGEGQDSQTGCYYLRARYYDPATAKFLTRDPLVAASEPGYNYASGFRRRSG